MYRFHQTRSLSRVNVQHFFHVYGDKITIAEGFKKRRPKKKSSNHNISGFPFLKRKAQKAPKNTINRMINWVNLSVSALGRSLWAKRQCKVSKAKKIYVLNKNSYRAITSTFDNQFSFTLTTSNFP